MPQSLVTVYLHLVFHVKTTSVSIKEENQEKLYAYITGILSNHGCQPSRVGGMPDHLHILCRWSANITIADMVEIIKVASNKYLKSIDPTYSRFAWQAGYGIFSVSPRNLDAAKQYIANQKEHHRHKSFREEYLKFLNAYHVDYNEDYVFKD